MTGDRHLESALVDAAEAWKSGSGETDTWARGALQSLVSGRHTPLTLAEDVYQVLKPRNSRGELVSPRRLQGKLSVRNLENATDPVPGAKATRKNLETVLRVFEHRARVGSEIMRFIDGDRQVKLYGLLAQLKES